MSEVKAKADQAAIRVAIKPLVLLMNRLGLAEVTIKKRGGDVSFLAWTAEDLESEGGE